MLGVFTWLGEYIYQALVFFFKSLESIFGPVLARLIPIMFPLFFAAYWLLNWAIGEVSTCLGDLQSIQLPGTNLNGLTGMELANTFFPLVETFGLIFVYLTFLAVLNLYRLAKSWIPTVSG
jgi:hypothetical protein